LQPLCLGCKPKARVATEVMWKPLFFQVNKEYTFGKTNKDSKVKKGILKKS
jgi:hypothetical protein